MREDQFDILCNTVYVILYEIGHTNKVAIQNRQVLMNLLQIITLDDLNEYMDKISVDMAIRGVITAGIKLYGQEVERFLDYFY